MLLETHAPMCTRRKNAFGRIESLLVAAGLLCLLPQMVAAPPPHAELHADQHADPRAIPAKEWIQKGCDNELPMIMNGGPYMRYRMRHKDEKGDEIRDEIETPEGLVARILFKDGRPLTQEEDRLERERLQHLIDHPSDFYSHHKKDQQGKERAVNMVKLLPQAMIFWYAEDQTPAANNSDPQVVIDFKPDPKFKPPTFEAEALQGLSGRIWMDIRTQHMVKMHGDLTQDISFGWGILGRLYKGGKLDLQQSEAGGGMRWMFSRLDEHLSARVVVKTVNVNLLLDSVGYQPVAGAMSYQDAIRMLLASPIPTHCPCE